MSGIKAACLIIGDEVLNGKITDTNSRFFAQYCYKLGINLKEIVTVGDDEAQIVDTLRRLSVQNDFIVTSGGIGPTHDDITYESVAKSFNLPVAIDPECKERMRKISSPETRLNGQALEDFYRMATLPQGDSVKNYYMIEDYWVPVVSIEKKVFVLPGIPQMFEELLKSIKTIVKQLYNLSPTNEEDFRRYFVKTRLSESEISQYLRDTQSRANTISSDIKIGSYPHFGQGFNTVSILGVKKYDEFLMEITKQTIAHLNGEEITEEQERAYSDSR
ncbi:unnamed protein product [Kluyveromyces dobzhanskii CBS 2104]|uniref:WGS project CCBQ000000000 data, contig 00043 n=1 Tax=Kluyveromyces dobzhanskii CBS 2104 TaxID=1427455 RepID=A0A0A8L516_9SACH|nr:unnamed protein product [Kluyveromyces dobzhanskii CBS 2104]